MLASCILTLESRLGIRNVASIPVCEHINRRSNFCGKGPEHITLSLSSPTILQSLATMVPPHLLTGLTPREAVADALHRCILGIDSNDWVLFESACLLNEEMMWIGGGFDVKGWSAIKELFQRLFVINTTHTISNVRIKLEENEVSASMTAHAISYHVRPADAFKPEDTSYTASSLYAIDLVKGVDDGLWRIKKWEAKVLWTTGDRAVLLS